MNPLRHFDRKNPVDDFNKALKSQILEENAHQLLIFFGF